MTIETVQGFLNWFNEDPEYRVVDLTLRKKQDDKDFSVFVFDRRLNVGQIVRDAGEIDLIGKLKFDLQRKMKHAEEFL